ncbi:uncharacterized protein [Rutidosis leptorrhynchoides]|uniref:uncharacterized protein n=1 Tax=Rutidosis leptorrhynchoides TaxID=125765 RepID=UPI003A98E814
MERLRDIFTDNRHSRALALEHQFTNIKQENFSSISAYCQEIKSIADQISNVSDKVTDKRMVLQLVAGLTEAFYTIGSRIAHTEPLPKFYEARSMLILEESRKSRQSNNTPATTETALSVTTKDTRDPSQISDRNNNYSSSSRGRGVRTGGRNNRSGNRGRGRNNGYNQGTNYYGPRQPWAASSNPWA